MEHEKSGEKEEINRERRRDRQRSGVEKQEARTDRDQRKRRACLCQGRLAMMLFTKPRHLATVNSHKLVSGQSLYLACRSEGILKRGGEQFSHLLHVKMPLTKSPVEMSDQPLDLLTWQGRQATRTEQPSARHTRRTVKTLRRNP